MPDTKPCGFLSGPHGISSVRARGYAVCANTVPLSSTMARTGLLSVGVNWFHTDDLIPIWLIYYLGRDMAEGVAWKLAPLFACFQLCTSYRSITT
jgi:hypothetical protein